MKPFRLHLFFLLTLIWGTLRARQPDPVRLDSVNSVYDEQNPRLNPDGSQLYFTRSGHPDNVGGLIDRGDIWVARKNSDGSWGTPQNAGHLINPRGLNGVVGFSANGKTMYLLNHFEPDGQGGGKLRNGIAKSTRKNGAWSTPERVKITYFKNNSEYISAFISPDERVMVLSLRAFQTFGNEDIYVTFRQTDGSWGQPRNLGSTINTDSEEWSPFLSADKSILYFSSNGHGGEGSRDVFASRRLDDSWVNWSKPINLGTKVNTKGVELGYFIPASGELAYFSSTRNSEGFGDLFSHPLSALEKIADNAQVETSPEVENEKPAFPEKGTVAMTLQVLDIRTDQPVNALVSLTFGEEEAGINTGEIESKDKKWVMNFEGGTRVHVEITAAGYLNYKGAFVAKPETLQFKTTEVFRLTPGTAGTKIRIKDVLFERSKATFADPATAKVNLDRLVELMQANPEMEIRLEGHTDNRGNPKLLKKLSKNRVETVKEYLVDKGIAAQRIETAGLGAMDPVAGNTNETDRRKNRRVEFVIISSQ